MRSTTLTIAAGASCAFPREAYKPSDLTGEQHMGVREGLYRTARYDGLDEDAADEAASQFYTHWLARDYTALPYARGDHMRAYYAIRAYARRSFWKGFTGAQRDRKRPQTVEMLAWRERRRAAMIPGPASAAMAGDELATRPASQTSRKAVRLAAKLGTTVAGLLATAYGRDEAPAQQFTPAPLPQPWRELATATPREPVYAANVEAYREALAAHYKAKEDKPLLTGDPRRDFIMQRLRIRAMMRASV
jgi:hypothetical protein